MWISTNHGPIGVSEGDKERIKSLVDSGCNIILIDVVMDTTKMFVR